MGHPAAPLAADLQAPPLDRAVDATWMQYEYSVDATPPWSLGPGLAMHLQ